MRLSIYYGLIFLFCSISVFGFGSDDIYIIYQNISYNGSGGISNISVNGYNTSTLIFGEGLNVSESSGVVYINSTCSMSTIFQNITVNKSINFGDETTGIRNLMYYLSGAYGTPLADGFRINYVYDFTAPNDDWLVFDKTDGNDPYPDGGIAFVMTNSSNVSRTVFAVEGSGNANFSDDLIVDGNFLAGSIGLRSRKTLNTSTILDFRQLVGGYPLRGTNKGAYLGTMKLGSSVDDDISSYRSFGNVWTTGLAIGINTNFRMADNGRIQVVSYSDVGVDYTKVSRNFGVSWSDLSVIGNVDMSSDGLFWCVSTGIDSYYSVNGGTTFTSLGMASGFCTVSPDGSVMAFYYSGDSRIYYVKDYTYSTVYNFSTPFAYPYFVRFSADNTRVVYGTGSYDSYMYLSTTGIDGSFSAVGLNRSWYEADISDDGSSIIAVAYTSGTSNGGMFRIII